MHGTKTTQVNLIQTAYKKSDRVSILLFNYVVILLIAIWNKYCFHNFEITLYFEPYFLFSNKTNVHGLKDLKQNLYLRLNAI